MGKAEMTRREALTAMTMPMLTDFDASHKAIQIGCQTNAWALTPRHSDEFLRVLDQLSRIGFSGFETGYANILPLQASPEALRSHGQGLTRFGVHIFQLHYDEMTNLAPEALVDKVLQAGSQLGFERLILSGAPAADKVARDRKADALNDFGKRARALGLKLAYHNHGPEFKGDQPEIDWLVNHTQSDLVWFLLDAGHAFRGGADVPAFIRKSAPRLTGLHLRDFKDGKQVPLGMGDFPLNAVAQALRASNWSGWVLAEEEREDGTKPGDSAVVPAFAALQRPSTRLAESLE
jgi:inosose dehydratase